MAAQNPAAAEPDSGTDSVTSTPRSIHKGAAGGNDDHHHQSPRVRLMCSFGGKILPRPHDNQLRYVSGDTRIVAVNRSISFSALVGKLSKLTGAVAGEFTVKYQLPNEDLDALITVSTDEDVENMMEEWERSMVSQVNKTARLRLFLFPNTGSEDSRASSITSLLDGSTKRESWFLDALNGGRAVSGEFDRGRSEVSSIVSELPDYLFGLDNPDDPTQIRPESKIKNRRAVLSENGPGSDPGSPSPVATAPSPFCSSSSAPACVPTTPNLNLPPVKTKPESPVVAKVSEISNEVLSEPGSAGDQRTGPVQQQAAAGYPGGPGVAPVWTHPLQGSPYPGHPPVQPVQAIPVYYVAAPGPNPGAVQAGQVQPVRVPGTYAQQYQLPPGQVPIGYQPVPVPILGPGPSPGQIYGGPVRPPMATTDLNGVQGLVVSGGNGPSQPMYYGIRGEGAYAGYPGMVMAAAGEQAPGSGPDSGRVGPV